jgi:hypothetical protein
MAPTFYSLYCICCIRQCKGNEKGVGDLGEKSDDNENINESHIMIIIINNTCARK